MAHIYNVDKLTRGYHSRSYSEDRPKSHTTRASTGYYGTTTIKGVKLA